MHSQPRLENHQDQFVLLLEKDIVKIIYQAHFISKTTDADMENSETQVWLDYALACDYINMDVHKEL